jgi:hypothetical protein
MDKDDPFDPAKLALTPAQKAQWASTPRKIVRRREQFVLVPWSWIEKLNGATGQTHRVALCLLYLHWKGDGRPIKLANGMLWIDGVSRQSKWRALGDLERRGLIVVERRPKRAPIVLLVGNLSHL